jgi:hypothetical protein
LSEDVNNGEEPSSFPSSKSVGIIFWFCWLLFPHITIGFYALGYFTMHPFLVTAILNVCFEEGKTDFAFWLAFFFVSGSTNGANRNNAEVRTQAITKWRNTFVAPLPGVILVTILPNWVSMIHFYVRLINALWAAGIRLFSLVLGGSSPSSSSSNNINNNTQRRVTTRTQTRTVRSGNATTQSLIHWPPPLTFSEDVFAKVKWKKPPSPFLPVCSVSSSLFFLLCLA